MEKLLHRPVIIAAYVFAAAMIGIFLVDGIHGQASAQLTNADCLVCHSTSNGFDSLTVHHTYAGNGCATCHNYVPQAEAPGNCTGCHYVGTPVYNGLSATDAHVLLHDKTDVPGPECSTCHVADAFGEHSQSPLFATPGGELDCGRCHNSAVLEVQSAINRGSGPAGQTILCDDCHVSMATGSHEAAHDNASADSQDCLQCHAANVVTEHLNRGWTCSTCHAGETLTLDPVTVQNAIVNGSAPNNQPQYCSTCHGPNAGLHESVHDRTLLPTDGAQNCTQCHVANVVTEHVTGQLLDCAVCHSSTRTDVFNAIDKGRTPSNQSVYCIDCHASQGLGHTPVTVEPWDECLRCHSSIGFGQPVHTTHVAQAANDCSVCHAPAPNCTQCHDNNTGTPRINIVGPGAEAHDRHTNTFLLDCAECHTSGAPGGAATEPIIEPFNQCDTCHTTQYGQLTHNAHITVTGGNCATCHTPTPTCTSCHDIGGPATLTHDNHTSTYQVDCATCHVSGVPGSTPIPAPFNSCDQCHTTLQPGDVTHNAHETAATNATTGAVDCTVCHTQQQPSCNQCHIAGDHSTAHDNTGVPSASCTDCHVTDIVTEHVDSRGLTCATCHDSTASNVIAAISSGKAGNFVSCYDCHGANNHHITPEAQSGNCSFCHADPRIAIDQNAPAGQLACRQCHINSSGHVQTASPAPSHAFNTNGNIKDFGACFSCHAPVPYHAKPAQSQIPDCWTLDQSSPYYAPNQLPGRGTFNLFSQEFRKPRRTYENTTYEKRAKDWCRDFDRNFDSLFGSPNISINMVSIVDRLNTNSQYSVPTFGSAGGGSSPEPDINLNPGDINFGSVSAGSSITRNSVIQNLGNATLTVTAITAGTGTGSEFTYTAPSVPFTIPVGGAATITVIYQPVDTGIDDGNLVINSNDPDEPSVLLGLSGSGEGTQTPDIYLDPGNINFGSVLLNDTYSLDSVIRNLGNADLTISSIAKGAGTSAEFTFTAPAAPFIIPAGGSRTVSVSYRPVNAGTDNGNLVITSNDPDESPVALSLTGTGEQPSLPDINLNPTGMNFGSVLVGDTYSLNGTIRNLGSAPLTVTAVAKTAGTSAEFTFTAPAAPFTIQGGGSRTITVTYQPVDTGTDTGSLVISSNDPDEPTVSLSLSGTGDAEPTPVISINPGSVNFRNVSVGSSTSQAVSIQNPGTAALLIEVVERCPGTSEAFTWTPEGPITVQPKTSQTLTVSYNPVDVETVGGCLTITSNDPNDTTIEVGLGATAVIYKPSILRLLPAILNAAKYRHTGGKGKKDEERDADD